MKKMRIIPVILVVTGLLFVMLWQHDSDNNRSDDTPPQEQNTSDWKNYEDGNLGIKLKYPPNWRLDAQEQGIGFLINPEEYVVDDAPFSILLRIEDNTGSKDIATWLDTLDDSNVYSYKKKHTQCLSLNKEIPEVCGLYAERAYPYANKDGLDFYTAGEGGSGRYVMIPHNDTMLIFAFGTTISENLFEPQTPEVKKLIDSFDNLVSSIEFIK